MSGLSPAGQSTPFGWHLVLQIAFSAACGEWIEVGKATKALRNAPSGKTPGFQWNSGAGIANIRAAHPAYWLHHYFAETPADVGLASPVGPPLACVSDSSANSRGNTPVLRCTFIDQQRRMPVAS